MITQLVEEQGLAKVIISAATDLANASTSDEINEAAKRLKVLADMAVELTRLL